MIYNNNNDSDREHTNYDKSVVIMILLIVPYYWIFNAITLMSFNALSISYCY